MMAVVSNDTAEQMMTKAIGVNKVVGRDWDSFISLYMYPQLSIQSLKRKVMYQLY